MEKQNVDVRGIEEIRAEYIAEGWMIEPKYWNYRVNNSGQRFYARVYETILESGEIDYTIKTAPSYSAINSACVPKGHGLLLWMKKKTEEEMDFIMRTSAVYGTIFHILAGQLLRGMEVEATENAMYSLMSEYCQKNNEVFDDLKKFIKLNDRSMLKDLLGFAKWLKDYEVTPIAMEFPVFSEKCAGTLDLVADITVPIKRTKAEILEMLPATNLSKSALSKMTKDQLCEMFNITDTERVRAIIDYKSGIKSFFSENAMQLYQYMTDWNLDNPDLPINRIFNYGCASYEFPEIKYRFADQSNETLAFAKWDKYVEIYHLEERRIKNIFVPNPNLVISAGNIENAIIEVNPLTDIIEMVKKQREAF
jgi:hypothetical protein